MKALLQVVTSSIGRKILMGVSGVLLVAFITVHMLGNLQIFLGMHALNQYAHFLKISPEFLWGFRLAMLGIITVHIIIGVWLTVENWTARPKDYVKEKNSASLASRLMIVSGVIILLFAAYHILHFTAHAGPYAVFDDYKDADGGANVYKMVVKGFQDPLTVTVYIVGVLFLAWHVSHGAASMLQSLGLRNRRSACLIDGAACLYAVVIFIGMTSVAAAACLGLLKLS